MGKKFTLFFLLLFCGFAYTAQAQESATQSPVIDVRQTDFSNFPEVTVDISSSDIAGNPVSLDGFVLKENGVALTDVTSTTVPIGVDVVFVIDASRSIMLTDPDSDLNRLVKVFYSISRFANDFMDVERGDKVSVIVPDREVRGARFFITDSTSPEEINAKIPTYDPRPLSSSNVNSMVELALAHTAANEGNGRYQAIVVFSDAGALSTDLDYPALIAAAQESHTHIFGAILGAEAEPYEIANMAQLTDPSRGYALHVPTSVRINTIYETLDAQASLTRLIYNSQLEKVGNNSVPMSLETADLTIDFPLDFDFGQPELSLAINSDKLIRETDLFDLPLNEIEPTTYPVQYEVTWPNGKARQVVAATLFVNGIALNPESPTSLNQGTLFTADWPVSELPVGSYTLAVEIEDEYGVVARSAPQTLTLEIVQPPPPPPTPMPTATVAVTPTLTAAEQNTSTGIGSGNGTTPSFDLGLMIAAGIGLGLIVLGIFFALRRQKALQEEETLDLSQISTSRVGSGYDSLKKEKEPAPTPRINREALLKEGETSIILENNADTFVSTPAPSKVKQPVPAPAPAAPAVTAVAGVNLSNWNGAYLESVEFGPTEEEIIPLQESDVTMGRDGKLAQIVLRDPSVSRLHARLVATGTSYYLYDEGSANGTFLNFKRVGLSPQPVKDGDDIHIGRVHLRYHAALEMDE